MKEAIGELNTTVVVAIAVGTFAVFFFSILWPMLSNNLEKNSRCNDAICSPCDDTQGCQLVECHLPGENQIFECPYEG